MLATICIKVSNTYVNDHSSCTHLTINLFASLAILSSNCCKAKINDQSKLTIDEFYFFRGIEPARKVPLFCARTEIAAYTRRKSRRSNYVRERHESASIERRRERLRL